MKQNGAAVSLIWPSRLNESSSLSRNIRPSAGPLCDGAALHTGLPSTTVPFNSFYSAN